MFNVNSTQSVAFYGRRALSILALLAMSLSAIVAAAPTSYAQVVGDPAAILSIDDYQIEPGPEPFDVLLDVDPLEQLDPDGLSGFSVAIEYDPTIVTPVLSGGGFPMCEALVPLSVSCGPLNPSGRLLVNGFTAADPGFTEAGSYLRIPFVSVGEGTSGLTLTIFEVLAFPAEVVPALAQSGSVTISPVAPTATCFDLPVTINMNDGSAGTGTPGNDVILGTPGDDVIRGLGGDDVICGGRGNDRLFGNNGNDVVNGGVGDDDVRGGTGDDEVRGGQGNDNVRGGAGNDHVIGNAGDDVLQGNAGDDTVRGGPGADDIRGGADNDRLNGGEDNDLVRGDRGDDVLRGGPGTDELRGGADSDRCLLDSVTDTLSSCEQVPTST